MRYLTKIIYTVAILAASMVLVILVFVHPPSVPRRNERSVIDLPRSARPVVRGCCVESVNMANDLVLVPNAPPSQRSGFQFTLKIDASGYSILAEPIEHGVTGFRSFYVDQTSVIRNEVHKTATAASCTIGGTR